MKKSLIILAISAVLCAVVYFAYQSSIPADPRGFAYAGSEACIKCHGNLYNSYLHTAHFLASSPASARTVHGSFAHGANVFTVSPSQKVVMVKQGSDLLQTWYLNGKAKESHRFDIVLGGVKGESYLYRNGDRLNQLPISYYTKQNKWLMSPGYAPGEVDFSRVIKARCLECHASFIRDRRVDKQGLNAPEQFDQNTFVCSIDCERCHGPGAQHANFQTNNPGVKTARFIATYSLLPRERRIDMCAVCHSGNKSQMLRSTFFFRPGDTLAKFKMPDFYTPVDTSHLDVHGNQVQLLQNSKCYLNSKMDCATCHDTHQKQRGDLVLFTQKCLGCHSPANHNYCKMANAQNVGLIKSNCVQCHMPALTTVAILTANIDRTPNANISVRTHHIAIYPEEAKKILAMVAK